MNKKLIFRRVKFRSMYSKEITDEQLTIRRLSKEIYGEATNEKKLQSNKKKKKTTTKIKKHIVFDECRHKSHTIKKPFIDDDVIAKRRVRDTLKRGF